MQAIVLSPEWLEEFGTIPLVDPAAWPILKVDDPDTYCPDGIAIYGTLPSGAGVEFTIPYDELTELVSSLEMKMFERDSNPDHPIVDCDCFDQVKEDIL